MFQQPSQGDQVKIAELLGSLVLIYALELRENIQTAFGLSDAVAVNLHVLHGPQAGESFENTLIFQKALIGSLRAAIGGDPVLGRVAQGTAKPGQSPPFILQPFTDQDAAIATAWLQARAAQFQAPANGQPAPPAAPAAAAPATGQIDVASLPPEVQELLKQTGALK